MSLTVAILMMITAWLLVAAAMLWGVLRIARRHHSTAAPKSRAKAAQPNRAAGRHRLASAH
ncbi:hypothetical protein [Pseudomonas sp. RIT-PI-S]|uniref:hypothetical protein n=1 Tax=Pseudomonas sp. RIT-PI-S TaxID=3035295 RepID=UPI0021D841F9|nr:hypothetical protein [Pseudomonas sp. RIT-PI-S]